MLANGAKLYHGTVSSNTITWAEVPGLKEIPELGVEPEKVENTCLTDNHKMYEMGIGDLPDMVYKFKYDGTGTNTSYTQMKGYETASSTEWWAESLSGASPSTTPLPADITFYQAQVSVKRTGGEVNGVIEFEATMLVQSDFTNTLPTV